MKILKRVWALGRAVGRLALMLLLCLCVATLANAQGTLSIYPAGASQNFPNLDTNASMVPITANFRTDSAGPNFSGSVTITVNGVPYYPPVVIDGPTSLHATANVRLTQNPMSLICYAQAIISGINPYPASSQSFDSRNPYIGQGSRNGQGKAVECDYSNIKLRGLRFDGRPCDAYNHRDGLTYPVTRGTQQYHWFCDNAPTPTTDGPYPAVYIRGSVPQLTVITEPLYSGIAVRAKVDVTGSVAYSGFPISVLAPVTNNSATISLPTLPNLVNTYAVSVKVNFQFQRSDGVWSGINGRVDDTINNVKIYSINAAPNFPMTTPWLGVLDDSCRFAANQGTDADVAKELTRGVYFSKRLAYPHSTEARWVTKDNLTLFHLSNFLNTTGYQRGNCVDVSDYLCICAAAQGLNFWVSQYSSKDGAGNVNAFTTNKICDVGSDPATDSKWTTGSWSWHQICLSQTKSVYDACGAQRYDLSGASYRNPAINWPMSGYWQTNTTPFTDSVGTWNHLGLTDYSGTYDPLKVFPFVQFPFLYPCIPSANPNPSTPVAISREYQPSVD